MMFEDFLMFSLTQHFNSSVRRSVLGNTVISFARVVSRVRVRHTRSAHVQPTGDIPREVPTPAHDLYDAVCMARLNLTDKSYGTSIFLPLHVRCRLPVAMAIQRDVRRVSSQAKGVRRGHRDAWGHWEY